MIETTTTTKQQTNKQMPKLYVLQYICQKKIVQKDTNILLQKKIKERDASASFGKQIMPIF